MALVAAPLLTPGGMASLAAATGAVWAAMQALADPARLGAAESAAATMAASVRRAAATAGASSLATDVAARGTFLEASLGQLDQVLDELWKDSSTAPWARNYGELLDKLSEKISDLSRTLTPEDKDEFMNDPSWTTAEAKEELRQRISAMERKLGASLPSRDALLQNLEKKMPKSGGDSRGGGGGTGGTEAEASFQMQMPSKAPASKAPASKAPASKAPVSKVPAAPMRDGAVVGAAERTSPPVRVGEYGDRDADGGQLGGGGGLPRPLGVAAAAALGGGAVGGAVLLSLFFVAARRRWNAGRATSRADVRRTQGGASQQGSAHLHTLGDPSLCSL